VGYNIYKTKWTDELVEKEIKGVMKALNLNRMPSNSEVKSVVGNGLACKISKSGGYRYWANKLNLKTKNSETKLGQDYEDKVFKLLQSKGYEVEQMTTRHPYDLLVNLNIKIDVKVSNLYRGEKGEFHTFNLEKHNHNCDLFICVCVTDDEIVKILVIPSKFLMKVSQLSVGAISVYDVFKDRFDYVEKYDVFYNKLDIE
jgi:hypothetical protein